MKSRSTSSVDRWNGEFALQRSPRRRVYAPIVWIAALIVIAVAVALHPEMRRPAALFAVLLLGFLLREWRARRKSAEA